MIFLGSYIMTKGCIGDPNKSRYIILATVEAFLLSLGKS